MSSFQPPSFPIKWKLEIFLTLFDYLHDILVSYGRYKKQKTVKNSILLKTLQTLKNQSHDRTVIASVIDLIITKSGDSDRI